MKTKSFQEYLEKRLDKDEIAEIEEQALLEIKILKSIQGQSEFGEEPQDVFKNKK